MPNEEEKPLLEKNKHSNYGITHQQPSINNSNSSSTESLNSSSTISEIIEDSEENNWINCSSRYGGSTQKKLDNSNNRENWEYKTEIEDDKGNLTIIYESFVTINNNKYWKKVIFLCNESVILELSNFNENNQFEQKFKIYENENAYISDLKSLDLSTFTEIKQKTPINWYFEAFM